MTTTITVSGMSCGHCEQSVEEALEAVDGVTSVEADNESGTAIIEGDADEAALAAAVDDAGYTAST